MMLAVAPGTRVVVRNEEWLVRAVRETKSDGLRVEVTGVSELVRDTDAVFFEALDVIEPVDPVSTRLVPDYSPQFLKTRLWLEALLRRTPIEASSNELTTGYRGMLDRLGYQLRPASLALKNLQPRILVADAVGLGKTLEIGIILSELMRRGRAERICVVTPRAVLEQFQREMWTRFSIPLVRLDSEGIAQIRQELPSTRNPFTYYKRVIVSIDTLKNPYNYRRFLQDHRWDVVVIDECHNVVNPGSQNFRLAKILADQTDALILASATPHNGKPESFAQLINLLDPTAIADPGNYDAKDIEHLFVRRHRGSPDVAYEVEHMWAERADPEVISVKPAPAEQEVLEELQSAWLHPESGSSPTSGQGARLFPWTLFKSYLSSARALRETIQGRTAGTEREKEALGTLGQLVDEVIGKQQESKLDALVNLLKHRVHVGPGSPERAVIFTERIATLDWLKAELPKRLSLNDDQVATLYGSQPDKTQLRVVDQFGLELSPIRVLIASDMASEGINLHKQCHALVHFDLPWSLIRLQQRNGRIDRYGQLRRPNIYALALAPDDEELASDITIITRLVGKEEAAHKALGSADALMHLHDVAAEETAVRQVLMGQKTLDEVAPDPRPDNLDPFERLMAIGGTHEGEPAARIAQLPGLFGSDLDFLMAALSEIEKQAGDLGRTEEPSNGLLALNPPRDLVRRMTALPASYLKEREVTKRLRVTQDLDYAGSRLKLAQDAQKISWPDCLYLSPLHPMLDWAADRVLAAFARDEAPVLAVNVAEPVFCVQATWSNRIGQAVLVHWDAVTGLPGQPVVTDMMDMLDGVGVRTGAVNPGLSPDGNQQLSSYLTLAVDAERAWLRERATARASEIAPRIEEFSARLSRWTNARAEQLTLFDGPEGIRRSRQRQIDDVHGKTQRLIDSLTPAGDPLIRVIAVLVPTHF
jgi:superfamily II DNA or RNA helicase